MIAGDLYHTGFWTKFGLTFLQSLQYCFVSWTVHDAINMYDKAVIYINCRKIPRTAWIYSHIFISTPTCPL